MEQGMGADFSTNQPTPSDFSEYVYCGAKWAIEKNSTLDLNKRPNEIVFKSRKSAEKNRDLHLGQQNEHKCLEWVLKETCTSAKQIVFNGIGENNDDPLTSKIASLGIEMPCKPDLIVRNSYTNLLYEFKAVSELGYLFEPEFDAYHAQVWCYTTLKELKIDEYYLVRYFIDPFKYPFTRKKPLSALELNQIKFEKLFSLYIEALEELRNFDSETKKGNKPKKIEPQLFNKPKEEKERLLKCSHCHYNRDVCKIDLYPYVRR